MSICLCVCLSAFFTASTEPFNLKLDMVFQNSVGKVLSIFLGPMVDYLRSYDTIKGFERSGNHKKVKVTRLSMDFV